MKYQAYKEYKDSGIKWLGDVPEHWSVIKGGYIGSIFGSESIPDEHVLDEGLLPFIKVSDLELEGFKNKSFSWFVSATKVPYCCPKQDYIVFPKRGAAIFTNKVNVISESSVIDPNLMGWKISDIALTKYVAHILKARGLEDIADVSTVPQINNKHIAPEKFPIPPKYEQAVIINFLDHETAKIDTLIEKQQQLIKLLKEKRQAVISHALTKGLNPNAPMRDSGVEWLGKVPEHWDVKPLKFLISDNKGAVKAGPFGSHLKNSDMEGKDVKVIAQKNVISRDFDLGESMISNDKYRELEGFKIEQGDILVSTRGTIGKTAIYDSDDVAILHPCLIRLQVDCKKVYPEFIALLIQESGYAMEQILVNSNATTIEVIYSENLINTIVCLPHSLDEQESVLSYIESRKNYLDKLIGKALDAIELMQERRTALISAAVTGKIDVRHHTSHPAGSANTTMVENND